MPESATLPSASASARAENLRPDRLFSMAGRVALVTGAAGGIGQELARGLAAAGARLVLTDIDKDALTASEATLSVAGSTVLYLPADLSRPGDRHQLVRHAIERFDRLDVLVNCAGLNRREPIDDVDEETFDHLIAIDLEAPYFLAQLAARQMRQTGGGSIIHIGSINSATGIPGVSVYAAAKAGLSQLARGMAVEWAADGIRVNCLAPGFTRTPLIAAVLDDPVRARWIRQHTPLGRVARPDELVGACLLLASDAGSFITGQTLFVDGGLLAGSSWNAERPPVP